MVWEKSLSVSAIFDMSLVIIYSNGIAFARRSSLKQTSDVFEYAKLPREIVEESISVFSLSDAEILSYSFSKALQQPVGELTPEFLEKLIGKQTSITILRSGEEKQDVELIKQGSLLNISPRLDAAILRREDTVEIVNESIAAIATTSDELQSISSSVLSIRTSKPSNISITYLTRGLAWHVRYHVMVVSPEKMRLQADVVIENSTDIEFEDVAIEASELSIDMPEPHTYDLERAMDMQAPRALLASKAMSESDETSTLKVRNYKISNGLPTTIRQGTTYGSLFAPGTVNAKQLLVWDQTYSGSPSIVVLFDNTQENGLGADLPAGTYYGSVKSQAALIGTFKFGKVAAGKRDVYLTLGKLKSMVITRTVLASRTEKKRNSEREIRFEDVRIVIRSSSDQPEAMVQLFERFESERWKVIDSPNTDSKAPEFKVLERERNSDLPSDGKVGVAEVPVGGAMPMRELFYTIRYD